MYTVTEMKENKQPRTRVCVHYCDRSVGRET